jgi:hypothetical protein
MERIGVLGSALQHFYNQEQKGDGQLKPPADYSHPNVTISQQERQQMQIADKASSSEHELPSGYALSMGEVRAWYGIAKLRNDLPLVERLEGLGAALQQQYDRERNSSEPLKPPAEYRHAAVTIPNEEQRQIETPFANWQKAIVPRPQIEQYTQMAL